jgi:sec-independent protein translocase protein TatC
MSSNNSEEGLEQSFISHLIELRNRLLRIILCVLLVFLGLTTYANQIYGLVAGPLMKHMPEHSTMIAIDVASPFLTPFKLALVVSVFISIPVILYQFWAFVAPGLYKHERRMILPLMIASTLLFYMGVAFAYFVVFPLVFGFLTTAAPTGVAVMTDITKYLDFALTMFFAFGICFEVPIFTIVMVWTGLVTPATLAEQRPYVIVGAFIIGMLLTPPDAISQTLLAIPMWLLFEIGLLFSRIFARKTGVETEIQQDAIEKRED